MGVEVYSWLYIENHYKPNHKAHCTKVCGNTGSGKRFVGAVHSRFTLCVIVWRFKFVKDIPLVHIVRTAILFFVLAAHSNASDINALLEATKQNINQYYVLSESIPNITASLDNTELQHALANATSEQEIGDILTAHLEGFDKHFTVQPIPTANTKEKATFPKEPWFTKLDRKNAGLRHVEIKQGNIGYIEFWGFANLNNNTQQKFNNVMQLLSDVDGLIIDLRENGGGSGEMVSWLISYFVKGRVHTNSFYTRYTDVSNDFYTEKNIDGGKLESVPLYILIGPNTFSAAEEFAYNLKHMGRATIIGEPSKGGANPWRWFPLTDNMRIGIPATRAINPITQTNWEGKGVIPNVEVNEQDALEKAYEISLKTVLENTESAYQKQDIENALSELRLDK